MPLTTCTVRCALSDQNGQPLAGAVITATLNRYEVYQGHVVPRATTAVTAADGTAQLALWPNALGAVESAYEIAIQPSGGTVYRTTAVVPNLASTDLHLISELSPYPGMTNGQLLIDTAADAVTVVLAAKDTAVASANDAGMSATNAATSAASASTSASSAAASAAAAATSESNAAASASNAATLESNAATSATAAANSATAAAISATNASDTVASLAAAGGSTLVGHGSETVAQALDARLPEIGTYALLRAYTGPLTAFHVICREQIFDGAHGDFRVIVGDTTSLDTDGTILVDALGRRWKREFSGAVNVCWFGADKSGASESNIQAALNAAGTAGAVDVPLPGTYLFSSQLTLPSGVVLRGVGSSRLGGLKSNVIGSPSINVANGYYSAIENLNISHATPASANTAVQLIDNDGVGVGADPAQYFRMKGVRITGHVTGVRVAHESTWCVFEDVVATGNSGTAFSIANANLAHFTRCIADTNGEAFYLDTVAKAILDSCTAQVCSSATSAAINVLNSDNVEINHLWCERNAFHNIHVRGTSRMTRITEMLNQGAGFGGGPGRGIYLDGTSSNTIIDGGWHGGNTTDDITIAAGVTKTTVIAPRSTTTLAMTDNSGDTTMLRHGQMTFPATQNPSTNANTLDDYEEGTWTPAYGTTGTGFDSVTYDGIRGGQYVKIGRLVHVQGVIRTDALTTGAASGSVTLTGLPFPSAASTGSTGSGQSCLAITYATDFLGEEPLGVLVNANATTGVFYYRNAADGNTAALQPADMNTGANQNYIFLAGTYMAAN